MNIIDNQNKFNELLNKYDKRKENILNALHDLQDSNPENYLSLEALDAVTEYFNITKAEVFGVVSYYSMFSLKPRGKFVIRLCKSPVCQMMDYESIKGHLEEKHNIYVGKKSECGNFFLELVECLGRCGKAPSMMINNEVFTGLNKQKIDQIIDKIKLL